MSVSSPQALFSCYIGLAQSHKKVAWKEKRNSFGILFHLVLIFFGFFFPLRAGRLVDAGYYSKHNDLFTQLHLIMRIYEPLEWGRGADSSL